jgi:hypothetical protein
VRRGLHQGDELWQARVHDVLRVAQVPLLGVLRDGHVQRNLPTIAIKITRKTTHTHTRPGQYGTPRPRPTPMVAFVDGDGRAMHHPPWIRYIYISIYIYIGGELVPGNGRRDLWR